MISLPCAESAIRRLGGCMVQRYSMADRCTDYLTIIQHPGGEWNQICVRENKLLKYEENSSTIW